MIGTVRIQNFKSIRELEFEPSRVNLFIGEPNTGKSNIIEALAFFSLGNVSSFKEIFRFKTIGDLFFDQKVANEISVQAGKWRWSLKFGVGTFQGLARVQARRDVGNCPWCSARCYYSQPWQRRGV